MNELSTAIHKIHPSWAFLTQDDESKQLLKTALTNLKPYAPTYETLSPKVTDIFNAFVYTPFDQVKVVIIGQDPYPTPGVAHGLSFSTELATPIPASLKNIYKALSNSKLLDSKPIHSCLINWALQGVLLLNSSLTVEIKTGKDKPKLHSFWQPWTDWIIKYLSDNTEHLVFLLWGSFAKDKIQFIDEKKHYVYTWIHPSPMAQSSVADHMQFQNCTHFTHANEVCETWYNKPIDWNPTATTIIFTDGACHGNGTPNAKGGYGFYITGGPLSGYKHAGPLKTVVVNGQETKQTNIRAETTAVIEALQLYLSHEIVGNLILVVDCEYVKNVIDEWLPMWIRKNKVNEMKNSDLLTVLNKYLREYDEKYGSKFKLKVEHVYSHIKKKGKTIPKKGTVEYLYYEGNDIADQLATQGIGLSKSISQF